MATKKDNDNVTIPENFSLYSLDVNSKVEKKPNGQGTLSYLSWSYAYAEARKKYPDLTYSIYRDEMNRPYIYDDALGYMVFTSVVHDGKQYDMWLPVMNSNNKAMKREAYKYTVNFKGKVTEKVVEPASMTDINKTIMRCLVKNLAVACGVGLYIYSGDDLPEADSSEPSVVQQINEKRPPAPPPEAVVQKCFQCGKAIEAYKSSKESYTAEQVAQMRAAKYGVPVCGGCAEIKRRELKAKEEAAANAFEQLTGGQTNE